MLNYYKPELIAIDGKSINSTVSHCHDAQQNFTSLISFFGHQSQLVLRVGVLENNKQSEIHQVQALLSLFKVDKALYYISTEQASVYQFGKWIQGHRRIENNLHWVKDVILGEDSCALSKTNSALVMGILRSIGLNLLRFAGVSSVSAGIMEMRTKVGMNESSPLSKEFV